MLNIKKAAMFGLDARIALAIFGALSVISGAALYSAISNAKATSLIADLNEIGKAWEQYYLDTGQNLPQLSTSSTVYGFYVLKNNFLTEDSGVSGWNGPYLPYSATTDFQRHTRYGKVYVHIISNDEDWGIPTTTDWNPDGRCISGKKCSIWVGIDGIDDSDVGVINKIDDLIDGSDGGDKGNIRHDKISTSAKNRVWLKYAPIKNPHD